jgi:hypothetical protein
MSCTAIPKLASLSIQAEESEKEESEKEENLQLALF